MAKKNSGVETVTITGPSGKSVTVTGEQFDKAVTDACNGKKFDGLPGKSEEERAFDELKELTRTRQILSLKTDGDIFSVRYKETDRERVFALSSRPSNMEKLIEKMMEFRQTIWKLIGEKLDLTPNEINIGYDKYGVCAISVGAMIGLKGGGEGQIRTKPTYATTFAPGAVGVVKWAFVAIDSVIRSENAIRSQACLPLE